MENFHNCLLCIPLVTRVCLGSTGYKEITMSAHKSNKHNFSFMDKLIPMKEKLRLLDLWTDMVISL